MKNAVRTMDLNLLKTLDALLDERSVTRAAERLALTQPAVSGMLTRLRDCFGDPLFSRTQRGIIPTLRALELASPVKQILSDMEVLLQPKEFDPASAELTLTLAATDYAVKAVVVPFIGRLRKEAPGVRVSVVAVDYAQLPSQLECGDVDLALVTPETTPEGLHARNLFDEEYVCIMRADHPEATEEVMTLDRFCALDQVLVSHSGDKFSGATDEALANIGRKRRVVMAVNSFLMLPEILRVSDLIAITPYRLASTTDGMVCKKPPLLIPGFSKTLAWHDRSHRDAGHRWLRAVLTELFT
ncbi:LysR family transcriptional regulator [Erwinia amylovora]